MKKGIYGKKLGMTQVFTENGQVVPVTVVEAGPCTVVAKKTVEKEGYDSVVVAFGDTRKNLLNKPKLGLLEKAGVEPKKHVRELRLVDSKEMEIGAVITAATFNEGDKVDVSGTTRGRGFTGVIQKWNQSRLRMSHGNGPTHRQVGSMGACSTPSRVLKGKKMPGHYGHDHVTVQNLVIARVDAERNILLVRGCVPGPKGSMVLIRDAKKA